MLTFLTLSWSDIALPQNVLMQWKPPLWEKDSSHLLVHGQHLPPVRSSLHVAALILGWTLHVILVLRDLLRIHMRLGGFDVIC